MARAASPAADLRRTATSAIKANDVYAQKCSTLKLMCTRPMATITGDAAGSSDPTTTQQINTPQRIMSTVCFFCIRSLLSFIGGILHSSVGRVGGLCLRLARDLFGQRGRDRGRPGSRRRGLTDFWPQIDF